jgi:GTP-binding protein
VSYQLVLTKIDKIKPAGVPRLMADTHKLTFRRAACFPGIIATSSEKGLGLDDLRAAIALVIKES